jgi:hypothetical protein
VKAASGMIGSALLLAALVSPAGCRGCREGEGGSRIVLVATAEARWIEIDKDKIGLEDGKKGGVARKLLIDAIGGSKRFSYDKQKGTAELDLVITVVDRSAREDLEDLEDGAGDEDSMPGTEIIYVLKYRGEEGWPLSTAVVIKADAGKEPVVTRPMGDVIVELVSDMAGQVELLHADVEAVRRALKHKDEQVVTLAVQLLGEKQDRESVGELCAMLDAKMPGDPSRDDIIGALEKIGDVGATPCLIRAFSGAETYQEIHIIRALSATGGEEARQFLEAVASGHEFDPVRRIAQEALVKSR